MATYTNMESNYSLMFFKQGLVFIKRWILKRLKTIFWPNYIWNSNWYLCWVFSLRSDNHQSCVRPILYTQTRKWVTEVAKEEPTNIRELGVCKWASLPLRLMIRWSILHGTRSTARRPKGPNLLFTHVDRQKLLLDSALINTKN